VRDDFDHSMHLNCHQGTVQWVSGNQFRQ